MSAKVVHLPEDIHRCAKEYCERNNITMTQWVSGLIKDGVNKPPPEEPEPVAEAVAEDPVVVQEPVKPTPVPVRKGKILRDFSYNNNNVEVESLPPFWTGRPRQE